MKQSLLLFIIIPLFFPSASPVCIESECPYKCCIDNNSCNIRPDCLLEDSQYCTYSSDCLSGCCHGKSCRSSASCEDYQLITGLVLGFFYFFLMCCAFSYCYSLYKSQRTKNRLISNRKIVNLYQSYMVKNVAKIALPFVKAENNGENKKMALFRMKSSEEKCNLNVLDEEKPNVAMQESPPIKNLDF